MIVNSWRELALLSVAVALGEPHMLEGPEFADELDSAHVERLASKALSMILPTKAAFAEGFETAKLITMLRDATLSRNLESMAQYFEDLSLMGISEATIVDHYIPEAARMLGAEWVSDDLSFWEVSVGSTRLQDALRRFENRIPLAPAARSQFGEAVVVTLEGAQHTLGASVLAHQLRREGVGVTLALGTGLEQLGNIIRTQQPAALMISASCHEDLESLATMVRYTKSASAEVSVLVGGNILERGKDVRNTIKDANFVASWDEALKYLRVWPPA